MLLFCVGCLLFSESFCLCGKLGRGVMKTSLGGVLKWETCEVQRWQLWSWQEILEVPPNVVAVVALKKKLKDSPVLMDVMFS